MIVAVYEVEARKVVGVPVQAIVAVYCVFPARVETGVSPCAGIVTPEIVELLMAWMLGPLLPPPLYLSIEV